MLHPSPRPACRLLALIASYAVAVQPALVYALPQGGVVVGGSAHISSSGGTMTVTQGTERAIIDWTGFDIGSSEGVTFAQPGAAAVALNRVGSGSATQIMGSLVSNGNVWIVNPHGVLFGAGARVNVGGLLASTADIVNETFLSGDYRFDRAGAAAGKIVNEGRVTVGESGMAAFVAPEVRNSGVIHARLGRVTLAAGETFTLDLYGDDLIRVQPSGALAQQLVEHSGSIEAEGGLVVLTAAAGREVVDSLINVTGAIDADTAGEAKGRILIQAAESGGTGTVTVSGSVSARGDGAGETGGFISVLGDRAGILSGSVLDASGDAGGGVVLIGGEYQGQGVTPTSDRVIVQAGSNIYANAYNHGDGGRVIVWADQRTDFAGSIEAKGGSLSGDGGFIETSGMEKLAATGTADASSPWGLGGMWLLDPNNITITTTADANVSSSGANPVVWDTTSDSAVVTVASILASLNAGTSVTVQTGTAGANAQAGDITVAADIAKTAGGDATLTLKAHNSVIVNSNVNITSTSNKLHVVLNADSDASGRGAIVLNTSSSIESNGGNITLGGGADPTTTAAKGSASSNTGISITAATINAGGGNILMRGDGRTTDSGEIDNYGIKLFLTTIETIGNGTVSLYGTGGTSTNDINAFGYGIGQALGSISAVNGAITLAGNGGNGGGGSNYGLSLNSAQISSTGTGTISLTGTGGGGAAARGVYSAGSIISSTSGAAITITGTGGTGSGTFGSTGQNTGIQMDSGTISNTGGNVVLAGTGGGSSGDANIGVYNAGSISATGAGTVTITGTGGGTGNSGSDYGVQVNGGTVSTVNGNLTLTGTGGGAGAGANNCGVYLSNSGNITSTGSAAITLTGIGGNGAGNYGIDTVGSSNVIGGASASGNVTLVADGMTLAGLSVVTAGDVYVRQYTSGTTMGLGTGAGTLSLDSTELDFFDGFDTLYLGDSNTGNMAVNTTAGILDVGDVVYESGGSITLAGDLAKTGGGNSSTLMKAKSDIFFNANSNLTATGNALNVTLHSDSDAASGGGIVLDAGSSIESNGGDITLGGGLNIATGYAQGTTGIQKKSGIHLAGNVLAAGGDIIMRGKGGTNAGSNFGIFDNGFTIETSGAGMISLTGVGGTVNNVNYGVFLNGTLRAVNGSIGINATGGTGSIATGVSLFGLIESTGSGDISITGTGGASGNISEGILNGGTLRSSGSGDIALTGTGGASGAANSGINFTIGVLESTGSGTVTLTGTGGGGGANGFAVGIFLDGADLSSVSGDIVLTGTGGAGSGGNNQGVEMSSSTVVESTGSADIVLTGLAGGGASTGIFVDPVGTNVIGNNAMTGDISLITNSMALSNVSVQTSDDIVVKPYTAGTTMGLGTGAGTLSLTDAELGMFNWGANSYLKLGDGAAGAMAINTAVAFAKPVEFRTQAGADITQSAQLVSSYSGTAIVLAAGDDYHNGIGAGAFNLTGGGRYLIYSERRSQNTYGGLSGYTEMWSKTYAGYGPTTVAETGNVILYSAAPDGTLSFTAADKSAVYGDTVPALTYTFACSSACLEGDAVTGSPALSTAAAQGSNAGSYAISVGPGTLAFKAGYGDYALEFAGGALTINKAPLTVTANNASMTAGQALPAFSAAYSGFVLGQTLGTSGITGSPALSTMASSSSPAGTYAISAAIGTLSSVNYAFSFAHGTLTIDAVPVGSGNGSADPATIARETEIRPSGEPGREVTASLKFSKRLGFNDWHCFIFGLECVEE